MCKYIKEKENCIPEDEMENLILAMYLNIIEYIDEEKQEELMEMIGLAETIKGIISEMKNEARQEEKKNIIKKLLKKYSLDEVSKILDIEKTTLINLIQR